VGAVRILIRGVGEIGSAVAQRLFIAGHAVVVHDGEQPTTTRRGMAFADAIFDGRATPDGVAAIRVGRPEAVPALLADRAVVPSRLATSASSCGSWRRTCSSMRACENVTATSMHRSPASRAPRAPSASLSPPVRSSRIDGAMLAAPLGGVLRGLTHDGVEVTAGTKVIEVDPRGDPALVRGVGERPARIADGVLQAIDAGLGQP
jgi:xanthine dehydrogenase accessory factor